MRAGSAMKAENYHVLGAKIREVRMRLCAKDRRYSLRQVAMRIGIEPSYLSKVEMGQRAPLAESRLVALAEELGFNSDELIAMAGGIPRDIAEAIIRRPRLFAQLIRELDNVPDHVLVSIAREARVK